MSSQETEHSRWFTLEVQPHEAALRAYLKSRFPSLQDTDDVIQETYTRLWREKSSGRIRHVRAFLFTAARNLALDFFRRDRSNRTEPLTQTLENGVVKETPGLVEAFSQQQELEMLGEAVQTLPQRCREVIMLRYIKGYSYKEIAALLDLSPETVKTHIAKGVRLCTEHFARRGLLQEGRGFHEPS